MRTNVLCFCRNMKHYNVGQRMTNGGLILASVGVLTALVGNRMRINAIDERVILGGKELEEKFGEMYQFVTRRGP